HATTATYTLSLHDALPILGRKSTNGFDRARHVLAQEAARIIVEQGIQDYRAAKIKAAERLGMSARGVLPGNSEIERAVGEHLQLDRKSTRLNSSHVKISYA